MQIFTFERCQSAERHLTASLDAGEERAFRRRRQARRPIIERMKPTPCIRVIRAHAHADRTLRDSGRKVGHGQLTGDMSFKTQALQARRCENDRVVVAV